MKRTLGFFLEDAKFSFVSLAESNRLRRELLGRYSCTMLEALISVAVSHLLLQHFFSISGPRLVFQHTCQEQEKLH